MSLGWGGGGGGPRRGGWTRVRLRPEQGAPLGARCPTALFHTVPHTPTHMHTHTHTHTHAHTHTNTNTHKAQANPTPSRHPQVHVGVVLPLVAAQAFDRRLLARHGVAVGGGLNCVEARQRCVVLRAPRRKRLVRLAAPGGGARGGCGIGRRDAPSIHATSCKGALTGMGCRPRRAAASAVAAARAGTTPPALLMAAARRAGGRARSARGRARSRG
jgi:hypothetical protein